MSNTQHLTPSPTRLRQIALVAKDLDKAKHLLTTILGTEVVFIDPGVGQWGLKNFLVAIGGDIIEVVAPFQPGTTAGRLLEKRGDGGYMIIMQTLDAAARREFILANKLSKVIHDYDHGDVSCVQYHPKGVAGGMMPELDSHKPTPANPTPLATPFSPWHACGEDYKSYSAGMARNNHLRFIRATCRLASGNKDTQTAARQWEELFGVQRDGSGLVFTNARMDFVEGVQGQPETLESLTIGIKGRERYERTLEEAKKEGLCRDGYVEMLGFKWYFVLDEDKVSSKL